MTDRKMKSLHSTAYFMKGIYDILSSIDKDDMTFLECFEWKIELLGVNEVTSLTFEPGKPVVEILSF